MNKMYTNTRRWSPSLFVSRRLTATCRIQDRIEMQLKMAVLMEKTKTAQCRGLMRSTATELWVLVYAPKPLTIPGAGQKQDRLALAVEFLRSSW